MRNIYLTGFSGSGKSTVGRLLGMRLGMPLRDLDEEIVAGAGRPIAEIFAGEGEARFRERESAALAAVAREGGQVVSTGGGVVVAPANRELLAATGWVVCLEARPETLYARVRAHLRTDGAAGVRPLLDSPDPLARIRALKEARQAAYAAAHWTVHTDLLTPERVAGEVARAVALLEREGAAGEGAAIAGRGFRFGSRRFGHDRPLVCVPVVAAAEDEAIEQAGQIAALAPDAIELRADWVADLTPARAVATLTRVAALGPPVIFTNRMRAEGGAREQDEGARVATLEAAIASGLPALVDVELATAPPLRDSLLATARGRGVPILLSAHNFVTTPDDESLLATLRAMAAAGADAAKIATLTRDEDDARRLLALCHAATGGGAAGLPIPLVAIGMGPHGALTRVLGHRAGSALIFAAAAGGRGSAPGQLTVGQLRAIWAATGDE